MSLVSVADGPNRVEFPLVRGMPYATAVYSNLTPFLFTLNAILAINDQDLPGVVTGNKLRMKINNEQVVIVYAWQNNGDDEDEEGSYDDEIQWKWDRNTVELVGPGAAKGNW
jgi:endoglucanase Acf2